jgi:hypothetical protein
MLQFLHRENLWRELKTISQKAQLSPLRGGTIHKPRWREIAAHLAIAKRCGIANPSGLVKGILAAEDPNDPRRVIVRVYGK